MTAIILPLHLQYVQKVLVKVCSRGPVATLYNRPRARHEREAA